MMQIKYSFVPESDELYKIKFEGMKGTEHCATVKDALRLLQIENPSVTFSNNMKRGMYDCTPDRFIARDATVTNFISELWHQEEDNEMIKFVNVVTLLANSLALNVKLAKELKLIEDID